MPTIKTPKALALVKLMAQVPEPDDAPSLYLLGYRQARADLENAATIADLYDHANATEVTSDFERKVGDYWLDGRGTWQCGHCVALPYTIEVGVVGHLVIHHGCTEGRRIDSKGKP